MSRHPISLAAGIMPEATPAQLVEAAVAGGFDFGGMWVERDTWTAATTRAVMAQLGDAGLALLDLEVAWIMPGPPDPWLIELVDIAAELGAHNLLCVSSDPDADATTAKLQAMVDRAEGTGVRINLEYALFTQVKSIEAAAAIVGALEGDGAGKGVGVLCDTLHWARSGGTADAIRALPREWLGYAQLCDAPSQPPDLTDMQAIITDAIDRRVAMGAGGLPLTAMVDALPAGLPVAIEERSAVLRANFPDLNARAREVARTSRAWLDAYEVVRT